MILPLPDRKKFETELRDEILERTDQKNIAQYLRIDKARISRQCDPHRADAVSPSYQILEWLWALDAGKPNGGEKLLNQIIRERNNYLVNMPKKGGNSSILTTEIFQSATELLKTESSESDPDEVLKRIEILRLAVEKKADDLKLQKAKKKGFIETN